MYKQTKLIQIKGTSIIDSIDIYFITYIYTF